MDVLQLLDDELKDKNNWSLEEKARYLYIRSCELFSYDLRYRIFLNIYPRSKVTKEIVLKEIDLRNVDDFRVVCTSYSRFVFKKLLEELLAIKVKVTGYSHKYNKFKIGFNRYVADATWNCDLERVKFGKTTKCYYSLNITRDLNDKKIEDIDKKIGYIEEEYFDTKLERIIDSFECEYEDKKVSELDYLLAKISKIKEIYDEVNTFKYFSDAFYCQEHLLDKFFKGSSYKFHNNNLYSFTEDGGCDLINILDVEYNGEKFNYVLKPVDGKYEFYEIPLSEGEHYKNELRMS